MAYRLLTMKISKDGRILTRKRWHNTLLRLPDADFSLWISAAARRGVTRAEFIREALREKAVRTLKGDAR